MRQFQQGEVVKRRRERPRPRVLGLVSTKGVVAVVGASVGWLGWGVGRSSSLSSSPSLTPILAWSKSTEGMTTHQLVCLMNMI